MTPTLHTLARFFNPWRTIRRLEAENRLLSNALADRKFNGLALHQLEMREMAEQSNRELRAELATAREALRRVERYAGFPRVIFILIGWIQSGMTGPLPPLPESLAKCEEIADGEAL